MALAPTTLYESKANCLVVIFSLQYPCAEERLRREQEAWRGFAHVEELNADHCALVIRPGGATELAA